MVALLLVQILCTNIIQKWNFPQGIDWGASRIVISDTDRDSNYEFIFSTYGGSYTIYFYELHLPDVWEIDSVANLNCPGLWDVGDFDADGFYDLAMQCGSVNPYWVGITVFESPDSFWYPTQEVWRDTVGFALVQPISTYDVDDDGFVEIFKLGWMKIDTITTYYPFGIYESAGDNQYDTIFMGTGMGSLSSTIAFGDFDADMFNEFVIGNIEGRHQIWECTGNNSYQEILLQQLATLNITDCFAVLDADGDGKLEFIVKGFVVPTARVNAFIFEATGDNTYETIKTFDLFGGHNSYYGGYSDAGDMDGDSVPEIALEACQNIYIIKAASNDSFYVWETLPGNSSGSSVRVFDIDGNGLSEVIISGNNQTRIYEYQVGINEFVNTDIHRVRFDLFPNPFRDKLNIVFQGQERSKSEIEIYDVSGRLVKQYLQPITTQQYRVCWDGSNNNGHKLPGGVYFVRLETPSHTETKKIVLLD